MSFKNIDKRLDKIEVKLDDLMAFRYRIMGALCAISVITTFVSYVVFK